jgi:glycosyltransferase involved in cell wall biosynthesis
MHPPSPHILHIITGLNDGGAEAVLYRLICQDGAERHHVVSLMDEGKYGPQLREAGARVTCLEMPSRLLTPRGLWRLWRQLQNDRPHVVQTWMYHGDLVGGVLARFAGVRRICWGIHNTTLEPGRSARSTIWIARLNARLSHWVPHAIVCCAKKSRDVHAALGYSADKMLVIPNGYDLTHFRPDEAARGRLRREWEIPRGTFVVGMVGRFDPQKDHGNLLEALGILRQMGRPFVCVLVGKDLVPENATVVRKLAALGLVDEVRLLGQRTDIPAVMNALDLHVLSSSYGEAFPNVLAEAMACGTPCVTTDVGDASLIVGDTGWVVPKGKPEALAHEIAHALRVRGDDEAWAARCAAARSRIVENFSIETMVQGYTRVWEIAAGRVGLEAQR